MELTDERYRLAGVAYDAYCKQAGGKSLATGDTLPAFEVLRAAIKDAWAASAIAIASDMHRTAITDRIEIDPGRVYALRTNAILSHDACEGIRQGLKSVLPESTKVIILERGMELSEVRPLGAREIEEAVERGIEKALARNDRAKT